MVYDLNSDGTVDRGEHPKNAGDRAYGHGDEITFKLTVGDASSGDLNEDDELPAGYFVDFDGTGGVQRYAEDNNDAEVAYTADASETTDYDAVLKHSAKNGEQVTVHLRGAQRVAEDPDGNWPILDEYADDGTGDKLIALR